MDQVYRYIQEEKKEHYLLLMALAPLARTPMDEKSGRSLQDYARQVEKMIDSLAPWTVQDKIRDGLTRKLRKKVASGTVVVITEASDSPNDPLFTGATIVKG